MAEEIEITPAMLSAGVAGYRHNLPEGSSVEPDDDMKVAKIYRIMFDIWRAGGSEVYGR